MLTTGFILLLNWSPWLRNATSLAGFGLQTALDKSRSGNSCCRRAHRRRFALIMRMHHAGPVPEVLTGQEGGVQRPKPPETSHGRRDLVGSGYPVTRTGTQGTLYSCHALDGLSHRVTISSTLSWVTICHPPILKKDNISCPYNYLFGM